ncbi:hypothetical protein C5Z25_03390 [Lactobacillus sp. CBA3605]|uniref:hypothetical protein n=1 Tax=Lactobacillus sp. CBA3605 TaxID=2099788 RepID=UPI000CFB62E3|nr:hypothetical protein [Lactobacillus sp. CBA3605]AVK60853.1 hypothetical protein C5Z25_03390 [Lactobacillus sp. CBA3605]
MLTQGQGLFYSSMLVIFLLGMVAQWYYRTYFEFLMLVHTVEILFMGVIGWYRLGPVIWLPLLGLWLLGAVAICVMHQFAK